ncbi:SdrD B-like domain-containing protein, partial [Macrococcoides canis]
MKKFELRKKSSTSKVTKVLIASSILAVPLMPKEVHAATTSILDAPNAVLPTSTDKADSKYEFIAQYNPELTKVETYGGTWEQIQVGKGASDKYTTIVSPTDAQKGKIGVTYTNVGIYTGKQVDLKITVTDWKNLYANDAGRISFGNEEISFVHRGYENVDYTLQYLDHETGQPLKVDGFMTVKDIDENQKLTFDSQTMNSIDQIYVPTKDTKVSYQENSDGSASFYSELNGDNGNAWSFDPNDPTEQRGDFTFMYSGTDKLNFTWGWQYTEEQLLSNAEKTPDVTKWETDGYLGAYLNYSALKPVATEILKPTKLVSDANEKQKNSTTLNAMNESLIYEVTHTVPLETEEFYYESYEITDTLNNVLALNGDVKVVDETNKDVTANFNITTTGQTINAEAKGDFVLSDAFYNHTYKLIIPAKVKPGADVSTILKDGVYTVPNTAKVTVDGTDVNSNSVVSKLTPTKTLLDKGIVSGDKLVDSMNVKRNIEYKYNVDLTVSNDPMMKSLILKDDLVDELDFVSAKVFDSTGKDITAEGTLSVDETKEIVTWTAKDATKYIGKKVKLEITTKVKSGADLSKYKQGDGTFVLPNTANVVINGGTPLNSDTVKVIVPQDPTYTIGDTVWNDVDKDNVADETEKGIPNAKVEVKDSTGKVVATATTDADGKYSVTKLPKGEYTVTFTPPTGYTPVDKAKLTQTITLDKDNLDVDLGLFVPPAPTYTIGDTVWNDVDKDNVVDETEKGIPNAKVEVKDSTGKVVATSTTDADGKYSVTKLPKGEYTVTFTPPTGYTPVDKAKLTQTIT